MIKKEEEIHTISLPQPPSVSAPSSEGACFYFIQKDKLVFRMVLF